MSATGRVYAASVVDMQLWVEVNVLLAREAYLLDDKDYERWLRLFSDPCLYWMPIDPACENGEQRLNMFYDDSRRLADRVARLQSGSAFSEDPPSMTARVVSTADVTEDDGEVVARSNFSLTAHRRGEQRHFAGRYDHRLTRCDGGLRIAEKRVVLLGSDAPQRPIAFLF